MANRLCRQTVTLYHRAGEADHKAVYRRTVLQNVYYEETRGVSRRLQGDAAKDGLLLCIFDDTVEAQGPDGAAKGYLPPRQWAELPSGEQARFWTLCPDDLIAVGAAEYEIPEGTVSGLERLYPCYRVQSVDRKAQGSPRMWHWEVAGA